FPLAVRDVALGNQLDRGVGHVVAEDGVIGGDVGGANDPAEDGILGFACEGGLAAAFYDEVVVGQNIHNLDGNAGDNVFRIVDRASAVKALVPVEFDRRQGAAFGQELARRRTVKKGLDAGIDGRLFGGFGFVVL